MKRQLLLICSLLLIPACGWWKKDTKDENVETQSAFHDPQTGKRICHTERCEERHEGEMRHHPRHRAESIQEHHEKTHHTNHHMKHVSRTKTEGEKGGILTPRRRVKKETTVTTITPKDDDTGVTMYRGDDYYKKETTTKGDGETTTRREERRERRHDRHDERVRGTMEEDYDYGYDTDWVEGKDIY